MYSRLEVAACAKRINRSVPTVWRWIRAGCRIDDPASLEAFRIRMECRKTNIARSRERRGKTKEEAPWTHGTRSAYPSEPSGNGELPEPGGKGAGAALRRLESSEEEAHRRLQRALERGNPLEIEAAQSFWLRVAETLRRLDAGLELGRRSLEEQVPKRLACDVALAISDWLRIAVMQFLSSEATTMTGGFPSTGEFKAYFIERFRGILDMTVKSSLKTNSPIPDWAAEKVKESWNVQER